MERILRRPDNFMSTWHVYLMGVVSRKGVVKGTQLKSKERIENLGGQGVLRKKESPGRLLNAFNEWLTQNRLNETQVL